MSLKDFIVSLLILIFMGFLIAGAFCLYAQDDDPHKGQPEHCTNAKTAPAAHKCECKKSPEESGGMGCDVEDVKCRVYCRKDKCYCYHPSCDS